MDSNFESVNSLAYDVFALNAHNDSSKWIFTLVNLKTGLKLHKWALDNRYYYKKTNRVFSNAVPDGPVVLKDKSLIFSLNESYNLFRIDSLSNVIWQNTDHEYHHSINQDADGNIWACTRNYIVFQGQQYMDEGIANIDSKTGKLLFYKSITEILIENGMGYLIHGSAYNNGGHAVVLLDLLHLNEVEPVLKDGPYWNTGDMFISLRNRSIIFLWRPQANKVLRIIQGPFYNQHDVDINSDSTISLFNNNRSSLVTPNCHCFENDEYLDLKQSNNTSLNSNSEVLTYNFSDSTFKSICNTPRL